jgi:hypothetical protein
MILNVFVSRQSFVLLFQCCLLIGSRAFGQTHLLHGTLLDEESNPIPYSSVIVKDDSTKILLGTISDLSGNFVLNLPAHYENDTVRISSVGFETALITVRQMTRTTKNEFHLRQSTTTLPTIVVRGLSAKHLIETCVEEIPSNYRDISFHNRAYYWRSTKEDSTYKSIDEGMITLHEDHDMNGTKRLFNYDSIKRSGIDQPAFISLDDLESLFFFDFVRTGSGITNPDNLDEWKFQYLNIEHEEAHHSLVVKATRHDKLGHFIIYINPLDYSFERVEFSYRWPSNLHILNNSLYKLEYINGVVQYQKTDKKYGIKYLFCSYKYLMYE